MATTDPLSLTARVMDALIAANIPCAIGGSIALQVSGYARGTLDGDVNVFLPMDNCRPALDALAAAGFAIDPNDAESVAAERGDGRFYEDGIRMDLFFNSIPLHADAALRTRLLWLGDRQFPALSPEDLVVLKALFNRAKDWTDIERIIAAMGTAFDAEYCRKQLARHAGDDDPSVAQLDRLVATWAERPKT